jgi:hypothetical protein
MQDIDDGKLTLLLEIEPDLGRELKRAAAQQDMHLPEYVVAILRRVMAAEARSDAGSDSAEWMRLSAASFARDWRSVEDRVYDDFS